MAIRHFKDIIEDRAYRISNKDRDIFERGNLHSFFGLSDADVLEFVLYDVNNNQLPQGDQGNMLRYIPMTTENIRDYFLVADSTKFQQFQFPNEYFIDAEELIREAGYRIGRFKVQISLLNRRVGFENEYEKLWITDISPSRTEIKVYPLNNKVAEKSDMFERYAMMAEGKDFKDDLLYQIPNFLEVINPNEVHSFIKEEYGDNYLQEVQNIYKINIEEFSTKIYEKFVEAMGYAFTNCYYEVNDIRYGKAREVDEPLQLTKNDIYKVAKNVLIDCINYYIPITENASIGETLDWYNQDVNKQNAEFQYKERIFQQDTPKLLQLHYERNEAKRADASPTFKNHNVVKSKRK